MGSAAVAALIAQITFWALLLLGLVSRELSVRAAGCFAVLWLAGVFGSPYVPYWFPFTTYLAVVDIVLVLVLFKGDVRLS